MANKITKLPDVVYHPQFLRFIDYYAKAFIKRRGFGRWLKEYQDMEKQGLFAPRVLRLFYIQILGNTFKLDFQKEQAVWYICCCARDAAEAYIDERINALYDIRVITGELAYDDDDDPYTDLTYEEATQIVKALNEEAEEELFVMKRKY
jgi:hypothetical protein